MLAIDILSWPGMNQAFLFSLFATLFLAALIVVYGKRRPPERRASWGEAMAGSAYVFFVMFLAYGIVPHQWLVHVQNELGWQSDKIFYGPWDIFKSQARGGSFPFDINYLQIGDIIVVLIYAVLLGLNVWLFVWWQKRGDRRTSSTEVATSTYGRPLVRKA
jgi:ABC-type multidrug transport system fused ATPase/permease subunit